VEVVTQWIEFTIFPGFEQSDQWHLRRSFGYHSRFIAQIYQFVAPGYGAEAVSNDDNC
jgi:hypothetical protein